MKVVVNRAGGMAETIHDEDFMFDNQRYYVEHTVLMPGDTMTTTCTYSAPATFGPSTSQEMCYFFSLHWPAGALRSLGTGTIIHGADSCL
jgi:Copper type II ascorbate-dependent monooxygenase, C-terminal domain